MRQGDGTDLLGPNDPRGASISLIYVDPNDDRQSVLTAILTQDKLGRKQVAIVLPEHNKAFQRPVDFDGLKNMRHGLKTQIVFVAPGRPGPAEFARQRRFPVYSSLESFSLSLKSEASVNGVTNGFVKRRLFGRKPKPANVNTVASTSSKQTEEEPTSPLPENVSMVAPQQAPISPDPNPDEDLEVADDRNGSNGTAIDMTGLAVGAGLDAPSDDQNASSTLENGGADCYSPSPPVSESHAGESIPPDNTPVQADEQTKAVGSNGSRSRADQSPRIIAFPTPAPRPKITRKFPVPTSEAASVPVITPVSPAKPNGSTAAPPGRRGNTGKAAAVVAGIAAVGTGAAVADRKAGGGGLPPTGNSPGGGGGGGGGSRKGTRLLVMILLIILILLLIGGIAIAAVPGGLGSLARFIPGLPTTATVTITPKSKDLPNTYVITAVTGHPDPTKREIGARILTYTTPMQAKVANATGSIPGTRATGNLTFLNTSNSTKTFDSVVLTGASGVPVSFDGPVTVPAVPPSSVTVTGFAVNVGSAGNIGALDISGSCCASGIIVKNAAFGGGQDPQPNSVIQQGDINGAANALVASLTPGAQSGLQSQVQPNEQIVSNTMQCNKSTFTADQSAGDRARTVTVTVAITCKEEVYDQQGALTMAANLLKAQASTLLEARDFKPGSAYSLTGNTLTGVTKVTIVDSKGTVSLLVSAEGVWVYLFSDAMKQDLANHIANKSKNVAIKYLTSQPGVSSVQIDISSGNNLPDATHITIDIKPVPGATGTGTLTPSPGTPTLVPTRASTPPITPTPTQGLGGI
jgi:hypothetical protein